MSAAQAISATAILRLALPALGVLAAIRVPVLQRLGILRVLSLAAILRPIIMCSRLLHLAAIIRPLILRQRLLFAHCD